jgi:hypothetical protein
LATWASEVLKQLASGIVPSVLSYLTAKWPILPFLNPQIASELWPITAILSFGTGIVSYHSAHSSQAYARTIFAQGVAIFGLVLAFLALLWMILVTQGLIAGLTPGWVSGSLRMAYVICFGGIGLVMGWGLGRAV